MYHWGYIRKALRWLINRCQQVKTRGYNRNLDLFDAPPISIWWLTRILVCMQCHHGQICTDVLTGLNRLSVWKFLRSNKYYVQAEHTKSSLDASLTGGGMKRLVVTLASNIWCNCRYLFHIVKILWLILVMSSSVFSQCCRFLLSTFRLDEHVAWGIRLHSLICIGCEIGSGSSGSD